VTAFAARLKEPPPLAVLGLVGVGGKHLKHKLSRHRDAQPTNMVDNDPTYIRDWLGRLLQPPFDPLVE
jgi:hypothetical protein